MEVWVAVLAACASVIGALFARASARKAQRSADDIDRRRHMVDAHDAEVKAFQDAYAQFVTALGAAGRPFALRQAAFAGEYVRSLPRCTALLGEAIDQAFLVYASVVNGSKGAVSQVETALGALRVEARAVFEKAAEERRVLVMGLL